MIITLRHARALNYCSKGMRYWCERRNINYMDFVKNGADEEVFLSSGDTMAIKVVEYAKRKEKEQWAAEEADKQ